VGCLDTSHNAHGGDTQEEELSEVSTFLPFYFSFLVALVGVATCISP